MQKINDEGLHPRPQLARTNWTDLTGLWGFAHDDASQGLAENWKGREDVFTGMITVPFPPESRASGIHDPGFHPVVWYRRTFNRPDDLGDRHLVLHCGAIDYFAQVWVNGQLVAEHEGGQTPFSADISSALTSEGEQTIVIRAEDPPLDLEQPRGKQDWHEQPHVVWYHRTSGVWQPIWLEAVASTHITRVHWTPDLPKHSLGLAIRLQRGNTRPVRVRVRLHVRGEQILEDIYTIKGSESQRQIPLDQIGFVFEDSLLWTPEMPNLIDATLTVLDEEQEIDEVQSYLGLRSVGFESNRFKLNNRDYYLRLVLEQGYWPESHLAAPSVEAMKREIELVKELGFNGIRIHQKVEDPRFLYWCDRLGLLVWGEIGNAYTFSTTAVQRLTREWLEIIERDYSHPSIVAWVPINESWGVPNLPHDPSQRHFTQALYHLLKSMDRTRPVIDNEGWEHIVTDIYGVHDYTFEGEKLTQRYGDWEAIERSCRDGVLNWKDFSITGFPYKGQPFMLTEFGGLSYRPGPDQEWFGYGTVASGEEYITKYRELLNAVWASTAISGFCYTQLTDTEQETNGLLTEKREPKFDIKLLSVITRHVEEKNA